MSSLVFGLILVCASTLSAQSNSRFARLDLDPVLNLDATSRSLLALPFVPVPQSPQPAGLVSARDLNIPPKAAKELERAAGDYQAFQLDSAVRHLQKALRIYPGFMQAHNNLGAAYLDLRDYEHAAAEFRQAIALQSDAPQPHTNLALTLLMLGRYSEAETAARQALQLDPSRAAVRATLGRILAAENRNTLEAVALLRAASEELPDARLPMAQVLLRRCAFADAAAELRVYLQHPEPDGKATAERWLAQANAASRGSGCAAADGQF
jgi:tetratricopeptide (TPR) repeat protein